MVRLLRFIGLTPYGGGEIIGATLVFAALTGVLGWFFGLGAILCAVPSLYLLWFFRDPERRIPDRTDVLLAPADGRVQDIRQVDTPVFLNGPALRIGIFMSPLNVHVNRSPCEGTVEHIRHQSGEFLPAYDPKAPERNESVELGLSTPVGMRVLVKQITGVLARRIVCTSKPGQRLVRGERYGMIKFGSRVEVYVPLEAHVQLRVKLGDRVRGGETILLEFVV